MALVRGNYISDRRIPSASSYSFSHTQNVGADGKLIVIIASPSINVSTVTYGDSSLSYSGADTYDSNYSTYWRVFYHDSPATGSNTLAVNLASAQYNPVSTFVVSFTGAADFITGSVNTSPANPRTGTITGLTANSMIIGCALGGTNATANMELPQGTARTLLYNEAINNYTWGAISPSLPAGTTICECNSTSTMSIILLEIKEAVAPVTRRIFIT